MENRIDPLILWQLLVGAFLAGLVWFVHVVHYPLMADLAGADFVAWHAKHVRLTGYVVVPPMLLEVVLAVWWLKRVDSRSRFWAVAAAALLAVAWAATFFGAVPAHDILSAGFDSTAHASLMNWNLVRTLAWSLRVALLVWVFLKIIPNEVDS